MTPEEQLIEKIDAMLKSETTYHNPSPAAWETHEKLPRLSVAKFRKEAPEWALVNLDPEKIRYREWRDAKGFYFGTVNKKN